MWHLAGDSRRSINWVRELESRLVKSGELSAWLYGQPSNIWNELLEEAVSEYELETGGTETSVDHFIEWLAEWGREVRRRQRGLLLLTAHRAKGLEFDHVLVLDGGWDRVGHGEDVDAPRRLYYVAMTRARKTLTLAQLPRRNPMLDSLHDTPSALWRDEVVVFPPPATELSRRYRRLSLRDVFLSYAGYRRPDDPVHRSIANLSPGDMLEVRVRATRWELLDRSGIVVGQLARDFDGISGMQCAFAKVLAVVSWDRERSESEYQKGIRCDSWEVVVPELVFAPYT